MLNLPFQSFSEIELNYIISKLRKKYLRKSNTDFLPTLNKSQKIMLIELITSKNSKEKEIISKKITMWLNTELDKLKKIWIQINQVKANLNKKEL